MKVTCDAPGCDKTGESTLWPNGEWPPRGWFVQRHPTRPPGWICGCTFFCLLDAASANELPAPSLSFTAWETAAGRVPRIRSVPYA